MRKALLATAALAALVGFGAIFALADWMPGDGYKMHFPQLPDEQGWNVMASFGQELADDWQCTETGPVNEIHFWGSWFGGATGTIDGFWVTIYSDIPDPDPQDPSTWSKPGDLLWKRYFPIDQVIVRHIVPDPQLWEGWHDPATGQYLYPDHDNYYQYNIINIADPYVQEAGTIYWLAITAEVDPAGVDLKWGWKSSLVQWNDDAVYGAPICTAPDNGSGTVDYPVDCPLISPSQVYMIVDGLPPGTTIELDGPMTGFVCDVTSICSEAMPPGVCEIPGGSLGGTQSCFPGELRWDLTGTGNLNGFNRQVTMPVELEVHLGPRVPHEEVQSFDADMFRMFGQLPPGDPDFDLLRISGGTDFGMPSPGHTTLSRLPDGNWNVDSFFDITYRIDFVGSPGGPLAGMSGSTTATIRVEAGGAGWQELHEPTATADTVFNGFYVVVNQAGEVIDGAGENAFGSGWYYYPQYGWWNIWFYDHPFDPARYKEAFIELDVFPFEAGPSFIELAINWSTDLWSIEQPPIDSSPPLPGVDEDRYIGRQTLYVMENPQGHFVFPWVWPDYNPEWVSIDVRGFNFVIPNGIVMHACTGGGSGESMDLSFVINSGQEDCCIPPIRGNVDYDAADQIDISDLVYLVDYMFTGGPAPVCFEEADMDCTGGIIDIADLVYLVDYMFNQGPAPCRCDCADCP